MPDYLPEEIDAIIEDALKGEKMMSAPINFHRRVEERVRFAALKERERARFRFWMLSIAASACGALFIAAAALAVTNLNVIVTNGVSGGKGLFDYYLTAVFGETVESYSGAYTMIASVLLAAVALGLGWIPVRQLRADGAKLGRSQ